MKKKLENQFLKRLAEVLGVTEHNMACAVEVVTKEMDDTQHAVAEGAESHEADSAPIAAGQPTSDKFDDGLTADEVPAPATETTVDEPQI